MLLLRFLGAVSTAVLLAGCYTMRPAGSAAPSPGEVVALDINDAGRVALGGSIGPEIARLEGMLVGNDSEEYILSVRRLELLRGGDQTWAGERVRVHRDYVGNVYERQFSRARSLTLAAVVLGGVAAFFVSRDLLGLGNEGDGGADKKPPPTELIWR